MLYIPGEFLFIRIPRTGGGSIRHALHNKHKGRFEWGHLKEMDKHAFGIEIKERCLRRNDDLSGIKTFFVVRNTWDRLISLYAWLQDFRAVPQDMGFRHWIRCGEHYNKFLNQRVSQTLWGRGFPDATAYDFDDLDQLASDFDVTLPHLNRSGRILDDRWRYYDDETRDLVARRFAKEIERYGFQWEPGL